MNRNEWHIQREDGALTLARRLPVRFDLSATTILPGGDLARLAHQIRQDMWRALRNMRGFAPVVRVERCAQGVRITAGGQVAGRVPRAQAEARIKALLETPERRARWLRWAS